MGYTVSWGDTLGNLAARFGTTVDALARANGIQNPDLIIAGSTLQIPGAGPGASGRRGGHSGESSFSPSGSPSAPSWGGFNGTPSAAGQGTTLNQMNFPGGSYKCGPTSAAMLADALGLSGGDAAGLVQRLSARFGIDAMQQTPVDTMRQMLDYLGISHRQFSGAGDDAIAALMASGKGVINGDSGLGGHYMMVDGYDAQSGLFTIKDPYGGVVKQMTVAQLRAWVLNNDNGGFIFAAQ